MRPATAATCASTNAAASRGQRGGGVDGDLRDRARPPRRDPAGVDLRPQPREPVAQLEGVADELLRRGRRDPEDGAELGEAELRHQRRTLTGDGLLVLTARDGERSRVVDRLRRVQVGPPGSHDQEVRRGPVLGCLPVPRERQQVASGEVVDLTCSGPCQRLDHVFDSTGDHRQRPWLWTVPGHPFSTGFVTGLRPSSTTGDGVPPRPPGARVSTARRATSRPSRAARRSRRAGRARWRC